ncbi:MAG: DUF1232 domain-containing protein [Desulfovibrionaceae bacterium]|nr:DUF1232 domain-containing protein [Desulfovibrionaceae bacterium]
MYDKKNISMRRDEDGAWSAYVSDYSAEKLWAKLKGVAVTVGCEGIRNVLRLFYALEAPNIPKKVKMVIYGALGYFISPLDVIPDVIPVVGFTDDLGVLAAAVAFVSLYITPDVKARADAKLADWFGKEIC